MICAAGDFDYGGAAFMGPLLTDYNVSAPRELLKVGGKFWFANFAQPLRDACEPPPGKPHDHDRAGISWVAFFQEWQQSSCGQGRRAWPPARMASTGSGLPL